MILHVDLIKKKQFQNYDNMHDTENNLKEIR